MISENITKIVKAHSCPNCGGPLTPPTQYIKPDEICSHCKQSIIWARTYLALLKNELKHETNETVSII
jgi:hypothetical protein